MIFPSAFAAAPQSKAHELSACTENDTYLQLWGSTKPTGVGAAEAVATGDGVAVVVVGTDDPVADALGLGLVAPGLGLAATGLLSRNWKLAMSAKTSTAAIAPA